MFNVMIKLRCANVAAVVVACLFLTLHADAVVINFDDLAHLTPISGMNYQSLTWELGNIGLSDEHGAWYAVAGDHPHSGSILAVNAQGSTMMGIGFPSPADMQGAYFSIQGNFGATTAVRAHGFRAGQELGITPWSNPISTTPQWLDMTGLSGVDRIVIESVATYQSIAGYYGMDDLTFTYVPEPTSLAAVVAGGMLLARRRRSTGSKQRSSSCTSTTHQRNYCSHQRLPPPLNGAVLSAHWQYGVTSDGMSFSQACALYGI